MARGRQINVVVPVIAAIVAAGALYAVVASSTGDHDGARDATEATTAPTTTETSVVVEPTTTVPREPVPVADIAVAPFAEAVPASYRITYEIVENQLPRTEVITVRRPYESLVVSERDGALVSGSATSRTRLWTYLPAREGWLVLQPELHRAAFDHRPLTAMATAISLDRAEERDGAAFAGRECRVFVTGQPLGNTGMQPPSDAESTELCIDEAGLVLHERWQIDGSTIIERTVTEVVTDVDVDPIMFDPEPEIDDAEEFEAVMSALAVEADEETLAHLQVDIVPPEGFVLDGAVFRSGTPDRGGTASTEIVRFYSNGPDLIEVAELASPGAVDLAAGNAVPVEIDGPETWFMPDLRASVVRTRLSETSYLELRGTNPAQLMGLLDTLTRRTG